MSVKSLLTTGCSRIFDCKSTWILSILVFAVGFTACYIQNLLLNQPGRLLIFDSQHFIETSKQMSFAIAHLFGSSVSPSQYFGDLLMLDGFAMPFVGSAAFLSMKEQGANALALLSIQSTIHSGTAVIVLLCAKQMNLRAIQAVLCALAYALYPPAIASSGTFLSEPLCTLLLSGCVLGALKCLSTKSVFPWFFCGALVEIIAISRTALLGCCILIGMVFLLERNSITKKNISAGLLGMITAALPWLMITAIYCNGPQLLPDRVPSENMALGCDTAVGGWETMPLPPLTFKYCWQRPATTLYAAWRQRPLEMFDLTTKKIGRLWFGCFNDFHDNVLFVSFEVQSWVQRLLIALALGSLPLLWSARQQRSEFFSCLICLAGIAGHFVYVPFESLPRYAFSSMPLVLLLVVYGLTKFKEAIARTKLIAMILIVSCLLLSCFYDQVMSSGHPFILAPGRSAEREISESRLLFAPKWIALLIDCDSQPSSVSIRFNGNAIQAKPISLDDIPSGFRHQTTIDDIKNKLCLTRGVSRKVLRQWRLVEIPANEFRTTGSNTIEIISERIPITLYVQKQDIASDKLCMPALRYFSVTKMFASPDGLDGRTLDNSIQKYARSRCKQLPANEEFCLFLLVAPEKPSTIDAETGHPRSSLCIL